MACFRKTIILLTGLFIVPSVSYSQPIYIHTDSQGNSLTLYEGSCIRGPIDLKIGGQLISIPVNKQLGCLPRKVKK